MERVDIKTSSRNEIVDITSNVKDFISEKGTEEGICIVHCPHTTAGITINENADPSVKRDIKKALTEIVPDLDFKHSEGNSDSHIKSSLIGCSEEVLIENNEIKLGTWQGIMFCEFDGPRNREIWLKVIEK
ncbi:MAG: secondary thiamine-phosphate synthase enzyme YjbQ [Candidatus Aenigmatarchaeota archaeon]